jgi:hypothetical protein
MDRDKNSKRKVSGPALSEIDYSSDETEDIYTTSDDSGIEDTHESEIDEHEFKIDEHDIAEDFDPNSDITPYDPVDTSNIIVGRRKSGTKEWTD